jgi:hypothetical protein
VEEVTEEVKEVTECLREEIKEGFGRRAMPLRGSKWLLS